MVEHIRSKSVYYLGFSFVILVGLISLLFWPKGEAFLLFNKSNSPFLDVLFRYLTFFGEWFGGMLVGFILLFSRKIKFLVLYLIAITISSLVAQGLKNYVFDEHKRPLAQYSEQIHAVEGVDIHSDFSFPSGHTTAAFCMFTALAIGMASKGWQLLSICLAVGVGVSRMYLGQHYLIDVVVGSILGTVISTVIAVLLLPRLQSDFMNKKLIGK